VSIVAEQCKSAGVSRRRSPIWISCLTSESGGGAGTMATLLQEQDPANNGPAVNSKGRLNFGKPLNGTPNDLITLADSNIGKTLATSGLRPSNDPADIAIGTDQSGGLEQRAARSISEYIDSIPEGSNYLERLTAISKTFRVPIATPATTLALSTSPIGAHQCRAQSVPLKGVTESSVIKWSYVGSALSVMGYGTGALQISTFATPNAGNVMVCNITASPVTPGAVSLNIREEL